jgi:hypothetical protein
MHTLHWIATKAKDRQEAFDIVTVSLMPNEDGNRMADWSDWHVVGGGRWSDSAYENSSNMIISYAEKPDEFKKTIEDIKRYRINYMNDKLTKLDNAFDNLKSDVVDYISNDCKLNDNRQFDFSRWNITEAIDMINSKWTCDSAFFDHNEFTSSLEYLQERLDKPEEAPLHYLVPVDFHF